MIAIESFSYNDQTSRNVLSIRVVFTKSIISITGVTDERIQITWKMNQTKNKQVVKIQRRTTEETEAKVRTERKLEEFESLSRP